MRVELDSSGRRRRRWRDRLAGHRAVLGAVGAAVGLAVLGAAFVVLPGMVVRHDLAGASVTAQDRLNAVSGARTTMLQAIAGLVVLFGAYATWRQLRVSCGSARTACGPPRRVT